MLTEYCTYTSKAGKMLIHFKDSGSRFESILTLKNQSKPSVPSTYTNDMLDWKAAKDLCRIKNVSRVQTKE